MIMGIPDHEAHDYLTLLLGGQYPDVSASVIGKVAHAVEAGALNPGMDERIIGEAEADRVIADCQAAGCSGDEINANLRAAVTNHLVVTYSEIESLEQAYAMPEVAEPDIGLEL